MTEQQARPFKRPGSVPPDGTKTLPDPGVWLGNLMAALPLGLLPPVPLPFCGDARPQKILLQSPTLATFSGILRRATGKRDAYGDSPPDRWFVGSFLAADCVLSSCCPLFLSSL